MTPTLAHIAVTFAWAVGGGLLTWLVTLPLHRRSLGWLFASVALSGTVSTIAAVIGSVRVMSLRMSAEPTTLVVALAAGLVASAAAAWAARRAANENRIVRQVVSDLAAGLVPAADGPRLSAELDAVRRELAQTAQRLADSREREHALESARRELVAWVSHDLRTPLASLRAMSEALEDGVSDSPEVYYKQIHASVDRLSSMVDDLFELSRLQAGRFASDIEQIALDDLVSDCIASLNPLAAAQNVELRGSSDRAAMVLGNGPELNRALTNLVANAIRHTRVDGQVDVTVRRTDAGALVTVRDECGGIPGDELGRVFEVGFRGEPARTPTAVNPAGAGLGLAIVRGIVEAHGGSVDVVNVDGGCSFAMRLPVPA